MFPSRMPGYNPDTADIISPRRAMQSALHPRSKATGLRLLRRLQRRRRKSMSPTSKMPAVVTLVAMSAVMAILFALLTLFLWRQGLQVLQFTDPWDSSVMRRSLRFVLPKRGRAMILNSRFEREHSCDHSGLTEGSSNC